MHLQRCPRRTSAWRGQGGGRGAAGYDLGRFLGAGGLQELGSGLLRRRGSMDC